MVSAEFTSKYVLTIIRDDEAGVWVVTSDDVPGLAIEAPSLDGLFQRLSVVVPELLEANAVTRTSG